MSKPKHGRTQVTLHTPEKDKTVKPKRTAAGLEGAALMRNWRQAQHHAKLPGPPRGGGDDED